MANFIPKNLQAKICNPVVASAMEWIDWCAEAEANNCNPVVVEEENEVENSLWETAWLQEPLSSIIANQEIIYNYMQESVASINQSIAALQDNGYGASVVEEQAVDEREQQRLQIQAQIEALQNEMENLY